MAAHGSVCIPPHLLHPLLPAGPLPEWGVSQVPFVQLLVGYTNFSGSLPESYGSGIFPQLATL